MAVARTGPAWLYWGSVILSSLSLLLVIGDFVMLSNNQVIQAEVNQRQQFLNQTAQLNRVADALIRALAVASVNAKDDKIRDMLAEHGITLTVTPNSPAGSPPAGAIAPGAPAKP